MKIKTVDDREFEGTAKEIVLHLSRADFICHGKDEYMEEVKSKAEVVYQEELVFANHEEFLIELERTGFITINRR